MTIMMEPSNQSFELLGATELQDIPTQSQVFKVYKIKNLRDNPRSFKIRISRQGVELPRNRVSCRHLRRQAWMNLKKKKAQIKHLNHIFRTMGYPPPKNAPLLIRACCDFMFPGLIFPGILKQVAVFLNFAT